MGFSFAEVSGKFAARAPVLYPVPCRSRIWGLTCANSHLARAPYQMLSTAFRVVGIACHPPHHDV
eukprot:797983-Lingulodinium_polyedra.AAC.1